VKPFIYFYMPVFNEQETAGVMLYRLREVMQKLKYEYTILLTLDGCNDETPQVIAPYLHLMPIRVVDRAKRTGYGKSLWEAISLVNRESANPKRDFFLILDAGFTQDPSLLNELNGQIERNADFCCGNRLAAGRRAMSLLKRLANLLVPMLLRLRGIRLKYGADLINTFQGARVQLLRRNLKQLQVLKLCGPDVPPSGVAMLLFLLLSKDARKYYEVQYTEKNIRRRASRFSIFRLLRFALFGKFYDKSSKSDKGSSAPRRRPRRRRKWKSNKPRPDSSKV
jgi:Glycosyl transferase family 2